MWCFSHMCCAFTWSHSSSWMSIFCIDLLYMKDLHCQSLLLLSRRLERRLPVSGLEKGPACHPERSEGSGSPYTEILRFARDDRLYLQISRIGYTSLTNR